MEVPFLQVASKQDQTARPLPARADDPHDRGRTNTARFQDAYEANGQRSADADEVNASEADDASGTGETTQDRPSESRGGDDKLANPQAPDAEAMDPDDSVVRAETAETETPVPSADAASPEAAKPKKRAQQADMAEMVMQHRLKSSDRTSASTPASAAGSDPLVKVVGQNAATPVDPQRAAEIDAATAKAAGGNPPTTTEEIAPKARGAEPSPPSGTKALPAAAHGAVVAHAKERSMGLRKTAADESELRSPRASAQVREPSEGQDISRQIDPKQVAKQVQPTQPAAVGATNGSLEASKLQVAEAQFIDIQPVEGTDAEFASFKDLRTAAPSSLAQVLSRPETPGQIARQMAEAAQRMKDQTVQIALNPKELGKVKMQITALEGAVTVSLVAERPETLDLMRRNIQELVREFHALGYDTVNFSFAEGQSGADTERNDRDGETRPFGKSADSEDSAEMLRAEEAALIQMIPSDGLDLRL